MHLPVKYMHYLLWTKCKHFLACW